MDISLGICFPGMKFCIVGHKVLLEGTVSQIFHLGLSFYFMLKTGNFWSFFKTFFSRLHKTKTKT